MSEPVAWRVVCATKPGLHLGSALNLHVNQEVADEHAAYFDDECDGGPHHIEPLYARPDDA